MQDYMILRIGRGIDNKWIARLRAEAAEKSDLFDYSH